MRFTSAEAFLISFKVKAACLWQAFPDKTNQEKRDLVVFSPGNFTTSSNLYGDGIHDFSIAVRAILNLSEYNINEFLVYPNSTQNKIAFLPLKKIKKQKQ